MKVDLPTPGTPEMPTRTRRRPAGQLGEQLPRRDPVLGPGRLDERDRPGDRGPLAGADALDEASGDRQALSGVSASRSSAESAITVPGRNTAAAPISLSVGTSSGGMTPPMTIMMSGRALVGQRLLERGQQREVAGGQRGDSDDVHVGVDRLLGDLLGRGEQRAHVDVEAEVGEGGDDDLLAAVVAVLAHLGDEDARDGAPPRASNSSVAASTWATLPSAAPSASSRYTPLIVRITAWCRP